MKLYFSLFICCLLHCNTWAQYDSQRRLVTLPPNANAVQEYDGWESISHYKVKCEHSYQYEYVIEVTTGDGDVQSVSERGRFEARISQIDDDTFEFLILDYSRHKERRIVVKQLSNHGVRTYANDDDIIVTTTVAPNLLATGYGKNNGSILIKTENGIAEYILHSPNPQRINFKARYKEELPDEETIYVEGKIKELKDYEKKYGKLISSSRSGQHWVKTYKRKGKYYTVYSSGVVEQY
ncbi:MAG: hypothetical protein JEZ08_25285 [Clostridiales bacterium]|nr:hypothetical protein [Clostridiales bacterium]